MKVQICPPVAESHRSPHFDRCQFERRRRHIQVGLAYGEFGHITKLATPPARETPAWATDDKLLRETVLLYLERRYHLRAATGTHTERLARIRAAASKHSRPKAKRLDLWIKTFRAMAKGQFGELPEAEYGKLFLGLLQGKTVRDRLNEIAELVQTLDSDVFISAKVPEVATAVAYCSYRLGWPSPSVAEHLRITAPCVRQILSRISRAAKRPLKQSSGPRRKRAKLG